MLIDFFTDIRKAGVPTTLRELLDLLAALEQGLVSADETALLFNCATGLKYPMPPVGASLNKDQPIDYTQF